MQILSIKNAILYANLCILQNGLYKIALYLVISFFFCTFAADFVLCKYFVYFQRKSHAAIAWLFVITEQVLALQYSLTISR